MEDFEQLDHYEIIGVSRDATLEEIKRAYRRQIGRYHPDRYANASPAEQAYVRQRTQRINEAYRVLTDSSARMAYNRDHGTTGSLRRTTTTSQNASAERTRTGAQRVVNPRDHQADLYEQARAHLDAGRYVQATATLRELQQINPFYRDSATLLAQAEAARQDGTGEAARHTAGKSAAPPGRMQQMLLYGGGGLAVVLAVVIAMLLLNQRPGQATGVADGTATPQQAAAAATPAPPTSTPEPSPVPPPTPTTVPSTTPTPLPPTPTPLPPTPTPLPPVEQGSLMAEYSADFVNDAGGFPELAGAGWSVGYDNGAYVITAAAGAGPIWSRRTQPTDPNFSLGVDVSVDGGAAGLLLRFVSDVNYLTFVVDPNQQMYRLQRNSGGGLTTIREGQSDAILAEPQATNRLVAQLEGSQVSLYINGEPVAEENIPGEAASFYGLVVASDSDQQAEARFNHFEARTAGQGSDEQEVDNQREQPVAPAGAEEPQPAPEQVSEPPVIAPAAPAPAAPAPAAPAPAAPPTAVPVPPPAVPVPPTAAPPPAPEAPAAEPAESPVSVEKPPVAPPAATPPPDTTAPDTTINAPQESTEGWPGQPTSAPPGPGIVDEIDP